MPVADSNTSRSGHHDSKTVSFDEFVHLQKHESREELMQQRWHWQNLHMSVHQFHHAISGQRKIIAFAPFALTRKQFQNRDAGVIVGSLTIDMTMTLPRR